MEDFFALVAIAGLIVLLLPFLGWALLSSRLRRAEDRLNWEAKARESSSELIASLAHRVTELERARIESQMPKATAPEPLLEVTQKPAERVEAPIQAATSAPPPIVVEPEQPIQPPPIIAKPDPEPAALPILKPAVPVFAAVEETPERESPRDQWSDRLRKNMGGQEWEAVVGGNWLNKVGVLVFVIGVALLLGYEFTRVGPGGRVTIGLAIGLTMLVGGALLESRK